MEILIIDGYNIINAWSGFVDLKDDLELARDKLVDILLEYSSYKDLETIIVFDAHSSDSQLQEYKINSKVKVIFTEKNETADSYIEKIAYYLVRKDYKVYVVTSDKDEQFTILGVGGFRISARELFNDIKTAKKEIQKEIENRTLIFKRTEVSGVIEDSLYEQLDLMRKEKNTYTAKNKSNLLKKRRK
ncbi:NYN domain-containing protein [Selenomonadales bacterium OttesenSCG-928-I06]|nr:NYN domain-containing protein [Selenomonadales bacterium OttesenSCG-928-I06]